VADILVIDDEAPVREMLRILLERQDHTVYDAEDGDVGMEILEENEIDLVITDILMPERDGLEIIRSVRRSAPQVKILAMSGGGRTGRLDFLAEAEEFGAHRAVHKPFRSRELLGIVDDLLGSD